jgi:hypothetical protein
VCVCVCVCVCVTLSECVSKKLRVQYCTPNQIRVQLDSMYLCLKDVTLDSRAWVI